MRPHDRTSFTIISLLIGSACQVSEAPGGYPGSARYYDSKSLPTDSNVTAEKDIPVGAVLKAKTAEVEHLLDLQERAMIGRSATSKAELERIEMLLSDLRPLMYGQLQNQHEIYESRYDALAVEEVEYEK